MCTYLSRAARFAIPEYLISACSVCLRTMDRLKSIFRDADECDPRAALEPCLVELCSGALDALPKELLVINGHGGQIIQTTFEFVNSTGGGESKIVRGEAMFYV